MRLTIDGDEGRPAYLEGQVLVWAAAFQKLGASRQFGSPDFFAGRRAQVLQDLVDLRTAAEIAAAGDERVRHWTTPLVEVGDAIRRKAQDRLFAGGSSGGDGPVTERGDATPQRARELYNQAGARPNSTRSRSTWSRGWGPNCPISASGWRAAMLASASMGWAMTSRRCSMTPPP